MSEDTTENEVKEEEKLNDESVLNWEHIGKSNGLSPDGLAMEIFAATVSLLHFQMEERDLPEIAVPMGELELILRKAPERKDYAH
ncbi:MAG: hypothetical protein DRQ42_08180 [Gammaproteobacteria bacterium]|nr:MAG: hypothetical protein DRQ42_08180 [Gammaproteobacteria bacterium]